MQKIEFQREDEQEIIRHDGLPVIVDDLYLISQLNLTKGFINRHAKSMGSFCRPRRFFLKKVLCHLDKMAGNSMNKNRGSEIRKMASISQVNNLLNVVEKQRRGK
jgi:hypothetical protein